MAIRFGMTLAEMIVQLTKGFIRATGRNPDGLEKIKIKQEAAERFKAQQKVVDMEGKVLDPSKTIMGGTQEGAALKSGIMKMTGSKPRKVKTEKEIEKEIREENKKGLDSLRQKLEKEKRRTQRISGNLRADNMQRTEIGKPKLDEDEYDYYRELLDDDENTIVMGDETRELLEAMVKEQQDEINYMRRLYDKGALDPPEDMADGGRIGFKKGMDRRTFMKIMGGLTTLPILGKFFKGAEVAAPVIEKAVEAAKTVPPYFLKLAEQIKLLGRQSSGPQERINVYSMKGKDGKSELMLTEDVGTGEMQIKKIGKENDEMVTEVQTMEYTPGRAQADETTKGTPADQYEEYTEYNSRIYKDEFNEPQIEDGIDAEDISKEIKDKFDVEQEILEEVARDKKASGGIARMLGE
jgi:hypothetical protein